MLAIAGDSASGKTTVANGLVQALGADRCTSLSTDDYHRFDRAERRRRGLTPLHPDCNYLEIMEQHLQLLAVGNPVLKPVYDHSTGRLCRPELVEPNDVIVVEGLLPLHTKVSRACFDITVYLDPDEQIRRSWKLRRDTITRGYDPDDALAELAARDPDSTAYVRPQRQHADIVVRFGPINGRDDPPETPLSAEVLLRPTRQQPDLSAVLRPELTRTIHMRLARDSDGRPVDCLHIHGYAPEADSRVVESAVWETVAGAGTAQPAGLGLVDTELRSAPLAITQMLLLHHLFESMR
jgi:phosphoribulokinase